MASRKKASPKKDLSLFEKLENDLEKNNSLLNLVLGTLIILVLGILLFNYFKKPSGEVGPTLETAEENQQEDVTKDNLPGKYTVKENDTLFTIAKSYYGDGYKFDRIAQANNISNPNKIEKGQVLEIPKLDEMQVSIDTAGTTEDAATVAKLDTQQPPAMLDAGTGGAENQTIWGEKITGDSYTVQSGDWLSKVAGRAYGDIMAYSKIASANNITNPDLIETGTILKLPR